MNKLTLSVAVAVALGLTGCGGESLDDIKQDTGNNTVKPSSRVVFDPGAATPRLSVPNDLLFQGTTDGTLTTDSGTEPNYTNPQVALGALDGWSTQSPYSIAIDMAPGATLEPSSVQQPGAVRIFEVVMQGATSAVEECRTANQGFACQVVSELAFGQDFVTAVSGNSVAVVPLKPLKPATTYMTVLTSLIEDSNGNTVAPSTSYELVKQDDETLPLNTPSQLSLQRLINSFEDVIEAEGVNRDTIIYTAAMTTQSIANVLTTVKSLMAASGSPYRPSALTVENDGALSGISGRPGVSGNTIFDNVIQYSGSFNLPYYLGAQTAGATTAPLSTRWTAACDSGAIIAQAPAGTIPATPQSPNDGVCMALTATQAVQLRDLGLDSRRHLTKFNPIPKINSYESVDVIMTAPNAPAPAAGWPVVIMSHGITSCKENMLAVTAALSQQGFATVAIDQPLHGSRGYTGINASGTSCGVANGNATVYMNLSNLLVTRDNLRQSIADTLALRLALNSIEGISLNMANVQLLGMSLGSITGSSAVAVANTSSGVTAIDAAYNMKSAALSVPGGAVANFLLESANFGALIRASVILGAETLQPGFVAYLQAESPCMAMAANQANFTGCAAQYVDAYLASLAESESTAATLAAIRATISQFAFAAQTITDAGDPNNYAQLLVASETPVYISEVIGSGINSATSDRVIPNQTVGMPLGGTEPLAKLLGATAINAVAGPQQLAGNVIARFTAGTHSSLLDPEAGSAAATVEMQTHVASFLATQGAGISVGNPAVLAPAN